MNDPLRLIGNAGAIQRPSALPLRSGPEQSSGNGPGFKEMLQQQIEHVNALQNDANSAIEDLASGRRDDLEGVIIATQKADVAFKMLLQVRNKVMDAYEEIKQLRI